MRPETSDASGDLAQRPVRRLRRSVRDRVVGGVCGGLGRYFDVDPVLMRIAAVAFALSGGVGVLAYIVAWLVIPEETAQDSEDVVAPSNRHAATLVVGAALTALGMLLVIRELVPWFSAGVFWPLVMAAVGVFIVASARR